MKYFMLIIALSLSITVYSQVQDENISNALDVSKEQSLIEENGLPTISAVDKMLLKANSLYDVQNWSEAISAYELFSKNANWLANILSTSIEPYYDASYDDRKNLSYKMLNVLRPIENKSNYYKKQRNKAMLRIGLCYKNLGNNEKAAANLLKALDLIDMGSNADWEEGRNALFEIIGYSEK